MYRMNVVGLLEEGISISIIIATYNRADSLVKAIDSVLAQSFKNWELWIVDDGSTDDTKAVVASYLNRDLPIYYLQQENKGVANARNAALSYVNGDFVSFLDSDDWYLPNHLELRVALLSDNPKVDLLHGGFKVLGDAYVPDKNNLQQKIPLSECFVGATMFVRSHLIKEMQGFKSLPIGADAEFYERAQALELIIMETQTPTYIYDRTGGESITLSFKRGN